MTIIKEYFELRTQQNESLGKLVEALRENNKLQRELLQQGKLNTKQLQDSLGLLMNSTRHSSETTIESDKMELQKKLVEDNTPTEADLTY